MRPLGFSVMWDKLNQRQFTTFRFPRKDTDWHIGERVQVVYRPRSKNRKFLFLADIVNVEARSFDPTFAPRITDAEAIADGFSGILSMHAWLTNSHGDFDSSKVFNKLTLIKVDKPVEVKK